MQGREALLCGVSGSQTQVLAHLPVVPLVVAVVVAAQVVRAWGHNSILPGLHANLLKLVIYKKVFLIALHEALD